MQPAIIFEDESLLVINKPSGMVVNKADTTVSVVTIQDWIEDVIASPKGCTSRYVPKGVAILTQNNGEIASSPPARRVPRNDDNVEFCKRAGIVHRLDKETSGILLIAKTPDAFKNLQAQFKNREVKKKYVALVHGKVIPESGEIKAPIGRLPWNRERFGVMPGGREAKTLYRTHKTYGTHKTYTLLELFPETGRTHQIRVHLQYLGFPIVGDYLYAGRKQAQEDRQFCPRVFLHAAGIKFKHPTTNKELEFSAELPEELKKILTSLRGTQ